MARPDDAAMAGPAAGSRPRANAPASGRRSGGAASLTAQLGVRGDEPSYLYRAVTAPFWRVALCPARSGWRTSFPSIVEQARLTSQALDRIRPQRCSSRPCGSASPGCRAPARPCSSPRWCMGLLRGGRFPVFEAMAAGRIARARLAPQPDDAVPRFAYEAHLERCSKERQWPESTRQISELRLVHRIPVAERRDARADARHRRLSGRMAARPAAAAPELRGLVGRDASASRGRATARISAAAWHRDLATLDPDAPEDEQAARKAAHGISPTICAACRDERFAMSLLPPGRFLMPGDLAGFAGAHLRAARPSGRARRPSGSLWAMMRRRYESYKDVMVRPFYRDHFARLDRQIVLVDALAALNAGPDALRDLEGALAAILDMLQYRPQHIVSRAVRAAHRPHPVRRHQGRPSCITPRMTGSSASSSAWSSDASKRANFLRRQHRRRRARGRARDPRGQVSQRPHGACPAIIGHAARGRAAPAAQIFDGKTETRDLSRRPARRSGAAVRAATSTRFRGLSRRHRRTTPTIASCASARRRWKPTERRTPALPHIRLDRALNSCSETGSMSIRVRASPPSFRRTIRT